MTQDTLQFVRERIALLTPAMVTGEEDTPSRPALVLTVYPGETYWTAVLWDDTANVTVGEIETVIPVIYRPTTLTRKGYPRRCSADLKREIMEHNRLMMREANNFHIEARDVADTIECLLRRDTDVIHCASKEEAYTVDEETDEEYEGDDDEEEDEGPVIKRKR